MPQRLRVATGHRPYALGETLTGSEALYQELRRAIRDRDLAPGARIPTERDLSEQFGLSRNTVRKSLKRLVDEGLIVREIGRGSFVRLAGAQPDVMDQMDFSLIELLEARLLFEPNMPDLVVERATEADIARMELRLGEMRNAASWAEFKEAKYLLHLAIAEATHNSFMVFVFARILEARRRAGWGRPDGSAPPSAPVRELAYRHNRGIVEALRARDAEKASALIRDYLMVTLASASAS